MILHKHIPIILRKTKNNYKYSLFIFWAAVLYNANLFIKKSKNALLKIFTLTLKESILNSSVFSQIHLFITEFHLEMLEAL